MAQPEQRSDRGRLEALRDLLEGILENPETSPRDLSSLSREYRIVIAALAGAAPSTGTSKLDEIAARRQMRGA